MHIVMQNKYTKTKQASKPPGTQYITSHSIALLYIALHDVGLQYIYIYIHTHTCMHACTAHTHRHRTYADACMQDCIPTPLHIYIPTCIASATHVNEHMHIYIYICRYIYLYICVDICIRICTYTYTYTDMHRPALASSTHQQSLHWCDHRLRCNRCRRRQITGPTPGCTFVGKTSKGSRAHKVLVWTSWPTPWTLNPSGLELTLNFRIC